MRRRNPAIEKNKLVKLITLLHSLITSANVPPHIVCDNCIECDS